MAHFSRRGFLTASAATAASLALPARMHAASDGFALRATTRVIEVNGRAATVLGLTNAQGGLGLTLDPGQRFRTDLTNDLDIETIIHWHGQIPPNAQDGVPNTNQMLKPGETRAYDFEARPGTFWMHSHIPEQEIGLLAAPQRHELFAVVQAAVIDLDSVFGSEDLDPLAWASRCVVVGARRAR